MKRLIVLVTILFFGQITYTQVVNYGAVESRSIKTPSDTLQYKFYLPQSAKTIPKIPIMFVLGDKPGEQSYINTFIKGSEAYQTAMVFINGHYYQPNVQQYLNTIRFLFDDVFSNLPVNSAEVYLSGYNNAARMASVISSISKTISGVMAIGSTIIIDENFFQNVPNPPSYVGIVNYGNPELTNFLSADKANTFFKRISEVIIYKSETDIPSEDIIAQGLRRFAVERVLKNPAQTELSLQNLLNHDEAQFNAIKIDNPVEAERIMNTIISSYKDSIDEKVYKRKLRNFKKTDAYKSAIREYYESLIEQNNYVTEYKDFLIEDITLARFNNFPYWRFQANHLDSLQTKSESFYTRKMAKRVNAILELFIINELAKPEVIENPNAQITGNVILTMLNPKREEPYLKLISISSLDFDYNKALYYVEELFKTGYKDVKTLEQLPGTTLLYIMKEYELLKKMYIKN